MERQFKSGCKVICNVRKNVSELLKEIISDYKKIDEYVTSGDFFAILNSKEPFSQTDVLNILFSFNEYKANSSSSNKTKNVLIQILNSMFITINLESTIKQNMIKIPTEEEIVIFLTFSINCLDILPQPSMKTMPLILPSILFISQQYNSKDSVKELIGHLEESLAKTRPSPQECSSTKLTFTEHSDVGRWKFREISHLPQYSDLFNEDQFVDEHVGDMTYESVDQYLETQFFTVKQSHLRHLGDFLKILKIKIITKSQLKSEHSKFDIYEKVFIDDLCPSQNGLVYRVNFSFATLPKYFSWEKSNIFSKGSLICFTNNGFETVFFATVVDNYRSNLSKGILLVQFDIDPIDDILLNNDFLMIDTKIRNESFVNILRKLQTLTGKTFSLRDILVSGTSIEHSDDYWKKINIDALNSSLCQDLNDDQRSAFLTGFHSNPSIIDGGTGTGKTYTSLKMIRYLIESKIRPILVVFYDDNSIDKFLGRLIETVDIQHIAQFGNKSESKCNISDIHWTWINGRKFPPRIFSRCKRIQTEINIIEMSLARKMSELRNCSERLVSFQNLSRHMILKHRLFFEKTEFSHWICDSDIIVVNVEGRYRVSTHNIIKECNDAYIEENIREMLHDITIELLEDDCSLEDSDKIQFSSDKNNETDVNIFKNKFNSKAIIRALKVIEPMSDKECCSVDCLDVSFEIRLRLYKYWLGKYRMNLLKEFKKERIYYDKLRKEKEQIKLEEYCCMLTDIEVIVMTTSSAAKYDSLLNKLRCPVVVVESAEKVPESHVIGSLTQHCQQLIMIGNSNLVLDDHIDGNLFKKFIAKNFQHFTLKQRYKLPGECGLQLKCGHICTLPNHNDLSVHDEYRCAIPCIKTCSRGLHQITLLCSDVYQCDKEIIVSLVCGHETIILCSKDESLEPCTEPVGKTLPCGHNIKLLCGESGREITCRNICNKLMPCGHICRRKCTGICKCEEIVEHKLSCEHSKLLQCGIDPIDSLCLQEVQREFSCGHTITFKCFEMLVECNLMLDKKLACGHDIRVHCCDNMSDIVCSHICQTKLSCRHKCQGACGNCPFGRFHIECQRKCHKPLKCGHRCDNRCHPGFCPPCSISCVKFCKHSQCASKCGEICGCVVCSLNCDKTIVCSKCSVSSKCQRKCNERCSKMCKSCHPSLNNAHMMYPCLCTILKSILKPQLKIKDNDAVLLCQKCYVELKTPYSGAILLFYKKEYTNLFKPLPAEITDKWTDLYNTMKFISDYPHSFFGDIVKDVKLSIVCNKDISRFDMAYEYYNEITSLVKNMFCSATSTNRGGLVKYSKTILVHLIKWLNPLNRHFGIRENYVLDLEKTKLSFITKIFEFLNSISNSEFALVHKDCYELVEKSINAGMKQDLKEFENEFFSVKNVIGNKGDFTPEEEELVEKIINAKDIYKEFNISSFLNEDKLKEIKNLIRRCHPDKNNFSKANNAVQILLELKKTLEKKNSVPKL